MTKSEYDKCGNNAINKDIWDLFSLANEGST